MTDMSLFSTLFRSSAPTRDASDSTTVLPWHAFDAAIERSLRMLRGVHIPISFFAVRLGQATYGDVAGLIADALSQFGPVGRLVDGSIGVLYLGPRKPQPDGNAALAQHVRSRVESQLREHGWPMLAKQIEFAATHGWTDEVNGAKDLVRALVWVRIHRTTVTSAGLSPRRAG